MGFDEFRGFWGTGLETCDGVVPFGGAISTYFNPPLKHDFGPQLLNALPGYWEQNPEFEDTNWCPYIKSLSDDRLSLEEKSIACKTRPRTLPKILDLDLLDNVVDQITTHNYTEGPILQVFATAMLHQPIAYPKEYDVKAADSIPQYFQPGEVKPLPGNDDIRYGVNNAVRFLDDLFGSTMQAIKDAGQWNNTIIYFTTGTYQIAKKLCCSGYTQMFFSYKSHLPDNGGPIYVGAGTYT